MYDLLGKNPARSRLVGRALGFLAVLVMLAQWAGSSGPGFAQSPPRVPEHSNPLTAEDIQKRIDQIEQSKEIDDASKASVLTLYREAMRDVLCRCGTYLRIRRAIELAVERSS